MKGALAVLAAALAGGMSADSIAATAHTFVSGQKRQAIYEAAAGEANRLVVQVSTTSRLVRFSDQGATISPGSGCTSVSANTVDCRIAQRALLVQVALGDLADKAEVTTPNTTAAQVDIAGGAGNDVLRGHGPTRFDFDGNGGNDEVVGSAGPDILRGEGGDDFLSGRTGDDRLIGDAGRDVLRGGLGVDRLFGGAGFDKLDARDQDATADAVVSCGPGTDVATEDSVDAPKTVGCERIKPRRAVRGSDRESERMWRGGEGRRFAGPWP